MHVGGFTFPRERERERGWEVLSKQSSRVEMRIGNTSPVLRRRVLQRLRSDHTAVVIFDVPSARERPEAQATEKVCNYKRLQNRTAA